MKDCKLLPDQRLASSEDDDCVDIAPLFGSEVCLRTKSAVVNGFEREKVLMTGWGVVQMVGRKEKVECDLSSMEDVLY
jgi:hypothetical protein